MENRDNKPHRILGGRCVVCGATDFQEKDASLLMSCPGRASTTREALVNLEIALPRGKSSNYTGPTAESKQSNYGPQFLEMVLQAREFLIAKHGRDGPFLLTVGGNVAQHLDGPYFRQIFPGKTLRERLLGVEGINRIEVIPEEAGFSLTLERSHR